jgi:phenylpyruvate tautomerase PptA (4-oxalocrotonate tautomerase family)
MPMIEMVVPEGLLDDHQKRALHERVGRQILEVEGADYDASPEARALTWMFVREVPEGSWSVGGELISAYGQPRFLTYVSVPPGSMDDERRAEVAKRVNDAIVDIVGGDPGALNNLCLIDEHRTFSGAGVVVGFPQIMRFLGLDAEPREPVGSQGSVP